MSTGTAGEITSIRRSPFVCEFVTRACTECGSVLPSNTEHFYPNHRVSSGLTAKCRVCLNKQSKEQYHRRSRRNVCTIDDCKNGAVSRGLCNTHGRRLRLYGDPLKLSERAAKRGKGFIDPKGYRRIGIKRDGRWQDIAEHRLVMEQKLGRRLRPNESVHHINGNRLDNRLENLELWVSSQPSGQRVEDLVAYAKEILALYGNE